jgi:hypothetical protein
MRANHVWYRPGLRCHPYLFARADAVIACIGVQRAPRDRCREPMDESVTYNKYTHFLMYEEGEE